MTHPYASLAYAQAFKPNYEPIPFAGGYVLKRVIPSTGYMDAMGIYPLMPLTSELDFEPLRAQDIVSLVLVADPFFSPSQEVLRATFDHAYAYKTHYLYDYSKPREYSRHHRYEVKRAQKYCDVRLVALSDYLEEWCALYHHLTEKHNIRGLQNFSSNYFAALAAMNPTMFGAFKDDRLVSAHLWFTHEGYAYSHLAASSDEGYASGAAYAVYDASLDYFAEQKAKLVNFGGSAGVVQATDGLARLKQGFSNASITSHVCGKILNKEIYEKLSAGKSGDFFPLYRAT